MCAAATIREGVASDEGDGLGEETDPVGVTSGGCSLSCRPESGRPSPPPARSLFRPHVFNKTKLAGFLHPTACWRYRDNDRRPDTGVQRSPYEAVAYTEECAAMQRSENKTNETRSPIATVSPGTATAKRSRRDAAMVEYDWDSFNHYATEWAIPDEPAGQSEFRARNSRRLGGASTTGRSFVASLDPHTQPDSSSDFPDVA